MGYKGKAEKIFSIMAWPILMKKKKCYGIQWN